MARVIHADRLRTYRVQYEEPAKKFVAECREGTLAGIANEWLDKYGPAPGTPLSVEETVFLYEKMQTVLKYGLVKLLSDFPSMEAGLVKYAKLVDTCTKYLQIVGGDRLRAGPDIENLVTNAVMFFHHACFLACGKRVFSVSAGLAQELLHTKVRGLDTEDLRLPLKCLYVEIPLDSGLEIYNDESDWHRLEGFYITEDAKPDIMYGGCRRWRVLLVGEPKPLELGGILFDNDAIAHFWIDLQPGQLDAALALAHTKFISNNVKFRELMADKWLELFQFAVNVILYITMPGAELEDIIADKEARDLFNRWQKCPKGKKKDKLKTRLKKANTRHTTLVGKSVVFDRRMKEAAEERRKKGIRGPLRLRFLRSGHFRMQPYGPKMAERKRIWIQPHWVGGADLPLVRSRTVKVQLPDESER